jgi:hypothetical protein
MDIRPWWPHELVTLGAIMDEDFEEECYLLAYEAISELAEESRSAVRTTPLGSPKEEEERSDSSIEVLAVVPGIKTEPVVKREVEEEAVEEEAVASTSRGTTHRRKGVPRRKRPRPQEDD